jgi:hypothetical protein
LDDCPDDRGPIAYGGGDGRTTDTAVVIIGACGSADGISAEYAWLELNLPGAKPKSQSLITGKRAYDLFVVVLPSGDEREVYFDISAFYGRL